MLRSKILTSQRRMIGDALGGVHMLAARDDGAGTSQRGWSLYLDAFTVKLEILTNNVTGVVLVTGSESITGDAYAFVFAYMYTNGVAGLWTAVTNAAGFTMDSVAFPPMKQDWSTNSNLTFGRRGYSSFEGYYGGKLDEWFYYKRVISSNEVWNIFSNKKSYPP